MTQRDKRSLIVLGLFLAAAVYYLLLLDPLLEKRAHSQKELVKARSEFREIRQKVSEFKGWKEDYDTSAQQAADLKAGLNEALLRDDPAELIHGLLATATEAGIAVTNLSPQAEKITVPETGQEFERQVYLLAGTGPEPAVARFLGRLGGLEVASLDLRATSAAGGKSESTEISLRLNSVSLGPLLTLELPPPSPEVAEAVKLEQKPPASPPSPAEPATSAPTEPAAPAAPPPPAGPDVSNLKLVGMATVSGKSLAAILCGTPAACEYFWEGDSVGELKLSKLDSEGAELVDSNGRTARLELPRESQPQVAADAAEPAAGPTPPQAAHKPGRLGLSVEMLTPELVKSQGLKVSEGLLVTKARDDTTAVLAGDVIVEINGTPVPSIRMAAAAMSQARAGDDIVLQIRRGEESRKVVIKALE